RDRLWARGHVRRDRRTAHARREWGGPAPASEEDPAGQPGPVLQSLMPARLEAGEARSRWRGSVTGQRPSLRLSEPGILSVGRRPTLSIEISSQVWNREDAMARATVSDRPRTEFLETYFQKYPQTPKEVILKADLLGMGHWFTDAALAATAGCSVKTYRLFSYDLMTMSDMKRKESRKVPEHFTILGGMYGLRPVSIQTTISDTSPYVVDVVDGRLVLTTAGRVICDVRYELAPKYYEKSFPDGTRYHEIVAFGSFITAFRSCQYWGPREECRFCDINENARQMKQSRDFTLNATVKSVTQVAEVANEIGREVVANDGYAAPISFLITGGTITNKLHEKTENEFYGEYVAAV